VPGHAGGGRGRGLVRGGVPGRQQRLCGRYVGRGGRCPAGAISGTGTGMERDWDWDSRVFADELRSARRSAAPPGSAPRRGRAPEAADGELPDPLRRARGVLAHRAPPVAINGAAIARGSSFLRDAMGEMVLPEGLSVTEDPHRPRSSASRLWDAEGLPTAASALVEDGRLTTWVSTSPRPGGSGWKARGTPRGAPAGRPRPSVTNIALTQGGPREDLAGMGTGLLVTSLIGSTINPNTGTTRGGLGLLGQGGQIAYPVNECTIAATSATCCGDRSANDARPHSRVVPSLLVRHDARGDDARARRLKGGRRTPRVRPPPQRNSHDPAPSPRLRRRLVDPSRPSSATWTRSMSWACSPTMPRPNAAWKAKRSAPWTTPTCATSSPPPPAARRGGRGLRRPKSWGAEPLPLRLAPIWRSEAWWRARRARSRRAPRGRSCGSIRTGPSDCPPGPGRAAGGGGVARL
jgi:hypothetical protein